MKKKIAILFSLLIGAMALQAMESTDPNNNNAGTQQFSKDLKLTAQELLQVANTWPKDLLDKELAPQLIKDLALPKLILKPLKSKVTTLKGHEDFVNCLVAIPNTNLCISGSSDSTLKIWDTSGELITTLKDHKRPVSCVAVIPNTQLCISGSDDRTLKIWDTTSGELLSTLNGHKRSVNCVAVIPNTHLCISGSRDRTLKIWDTTSGQLITTLKGHKDIVSCVAVIPNTQLCISGSYDRTLKIWDTNSRELITTLKGHEGPVNCVAVIPNTQLCISGSLDRTLKIWDLSVLLAAHTWLENPSFDEALLLLMYEYKYKKKHPEILEAIKEYFVKKQGQVPTLKELLISKGILPNTKSNNCSIV